MCKYLSKPCSNCRHYEDIPQVVFAVVCYRTLRQPPNLLLLALAVTDLCVSVVVMPGNN